MTLIHRVHAGLSARREEGRVVLMRWMSAPDGTQVPVPVAVFTPNEWVETICALSPDWAGLTPADQALRRGAVIRIVEGRDA